MSVPVFLNFAPLYSEHINIIGDGADHGTQRIIDYVYDLLVTAGGWAHSAAHGSSPNTFTTPADPDGAGRQVKITMTVVDDATLTWTVVDQNTNTLCTRVIVIDAANGNTVQIFGSPFYCWVCVYRPTQAIPEFAIAGYLDQTPEAQNSNPNHGCYGDAGRINTGPGYTYRGGDYIDTSFMWDNAAAVATTRLYEWGLFTSSTPRLVTPQGVYFFCEANIGVLDTGGAARWAGRMYGVYICSSSLPYSSEMYIPIDVGVVGKFKVFGRQAGNNNSLLCIRIA
jgi:hypothetical protein